MSKLKSLAVLIFLCQTGIITYYSADFIGSKMNTNAGYNYMEYTRDPVNVCVIRRARFIGSITTYGKIKSAYSTIINTPTISGYKIIVDKILTVTGQKVKKGQTIVQFKCDELKFKTESSYADYKQQNEVMSRINKARQALSDHEYRKAKLQLEKYFAEYNSIKCHHDSLKIVSPFEGIIGMIGLVEGESVTTERPITQVVDNETLDVEFYIDSINAETLSNGYDVTIETVDGEYAASATITDINPYIDEHISKVKLKARLNKDTTDTKIFKHNLNVNVVIDKHPIDDVFVVPRSAIIDAGSSSYVCKAERRPGSYETRMIKINILDYKGDKAAIVGPSLYESDYVIYEGYIKRDGMTVIIKEILD